jgi:hypothetical protein
VESRKKIESGGKLSFRLRMISKSLRLNTSLDLACIYSLTRADLFGCAMRRRKLELKDGKVRLLLRLLSTCKSGETILSLSKTSLMTASSTT